MLSELRIRDYALIDDLAIEFGPGLNILTGETGTGKSIIIGALSLVLGGRADPSVVRTGADDTTVEARFEDVGKPADECARAGVDVSEDVLILRRRAGRTGRSSAWANESAVTVSVLRRVGDRLVDLHGQHQHQLLLNPDQHLEILDAWADLGAERDRFAGAFDDCETRRRELAAVESELKERQHRRDLTEFQLKELSGAHVEPGEIDALRTEQEQLASAEQRSTLARELRELLSDREGSISELLAATTERLATLGRLDDRLKEKHTTAVSVQAQLDDLWRDIVSYGEDIRFSPERLDEVNARLFLIEKLAKKYVVKADELPALEAQLRTELDSVELDEDRCVGLRRDIERRSARLLKDAAALSARRRRAGDELAAKILPEFSALGLEHAELAVQVTHPDRPGDSDLTRLGFDTVEFLFSANPGEGLKPLRKVASGGELSRIMLAIKNILARASIVPTMVFDEVDSGIGGRVAEAVGKRLARLGRDRQVICITHLPQIARHADQHYLITKSARRGRTRTGIRRLDDKARVQELARMSAGAEVTETGLAHARELLGRRKRDA